MKISRLPMLDWLNRDAEERPSIARWEVAFIATAVCLSLALGLSNLGKPSLWHDELVHVFVAKSITQTLEPRLPSGQIYVNANTFNYLLALFLALFGDSETAVRIPSVIIAAINVPLTYLLLRGLLGRPTALLAACTLALSPWSVAWARQARFYALQQTIYMLFLWAAWRAMNEPDRRRAALRGAGAIGLFVLGLLTSIHSVLFLGPVGAYAFFRGLSQRKLASRWTLICAAILITVAVCGVSYYLFLPGMDHKATFDNAGLGGKTQEPTVDPARSVRMFYLHWFNYNLSSGYVILMLAGSALILVKGRRPGFYAFLSFWVPFLALTFLIGYRRPRFIYFAYPFFVAAHSYAIIALAQFMISWRKSWLHVAASALILVFGVRLSWSTARLLGDSLSVASGHSITLARRHPQWREPCRYVRENMTSDDAIVSTTALPVLYYVGRVDDWFPSRIMYWEKVELGTKGLDAPEDFAEFIKTHKRGYFLAEYRRFHYWHRHLKPEIDWVEANLERLEDVSSEDVTVYRWGYNGTAEKTHSAD